MAKEQSKLERELSEFRDKNFSHNSAEEFLRFNGENPSNFESVHLSAAYVKAENDDDKIYKTELKLAQKAMEKRCRYVTNMDYCSNCIAATGLKPR